MNSVDPLSDDTAIQFPSSNENPTDGIWQSLVPEEKPEDVQDNGYRWIIDAAEVPEADLMDTSSFDLAEQLFDGLSLGTVTLYPDALEYPVLNNQSTVSTFANHQKIAHSASLTPDGSFTLEEVVQLISLGTTAEELNEIIADAAEGTVLVLAEGTHIFDQGLVIDRDNITLRGESETGTIIEFDFEPGSEGHGIEIQGGSKQYLSYAVEDASAGSNQLVLHQGHSAEVGTKLYITQPNTQDYLAENGWNNVSWEDADERPFREFISEVIAVDGNTVTLASELPYDFDAIATSVREIDLIEGIVLADFTVTHAIDRVNNVYDFANVLPEFQNTASIMVQGTYGADFQNISILDAPSNGFDIRSSLDFTGNNLLVDGANNLGGGGNGYGIQLYETFGSTITDTDIFDVRHAVLFSSWNAETGNVIELSATNRDINFHGSPDTGNTVTVANAIMDYDPSQNTGNTRGYWDIVSEGGRSHANTDYYENNTVRFGHAEGSDGYETIYGWDEGAYLSGNNGWDTLFGGLGSDILIGGTGKDNLHGGEGDDVFVFRLGDSYDRIHDFSGVSGDRIAIIDTPNIDSFEDLTVWQNGDDAYVRYGGNSTIILSDYDAAELNAEDFDFDWSAPPTGLV